MDVAQYYSTTLTTAFYKILPALAYLLAGYFIFVRLPFLFLLKNMKNSKTPAAEVIVKERVEIPHAIPFKEKPKPKPKAKIKPSFTENHTPESLFNFTAGQVFTKNELRKKYHTLLKMNHPDKVASLSPEFQRLADKKTTDINEAYVKLLKRAV